MRHSDQLTLLLAASAAASCGASTAAPARANLPALTAAPTVLVAEPEAEAEPTAPPPNEVIADAALRGVAAWPMFHGSPARHGRSVAPAVKSPRIRWQARVGIQSWLNSPLVLGEIVFVPSSGRTHNVADRADGVYALDLATGVQRWFTRLPADANGAAATAERVFVTADDGWVRALDARTGKEVWKARGEGKMYSHPLLFGELVVVGDAGGNLRAYAATSGEPRWSVALPGAIRGGAAADDRTLYAVSQGGEAIALDADGRELWRSAVLRPAWSDAGAAQPIDVYSTPVVTESLIVLPYARDTYYDVPALVALDKRTGREAWRATGDGQWGNVRSTPAVIDGVLVYGEPYSGDVVGIEVDTGKLAFRTTVGACTFPQWASPAAATGVVYVPRYGGTLYAVEPRHGAVQWELYIGDSQLLGVHQDYDDSCSWDAPHHALYSPAAIAPDGTVLVGSAEGLLFAIGEA